jgi:hypothetical protein
LVKAGTFSAIVGFLLTAIANFNNLVEFFRNILGWTRSDRSQLPTPEPTQTLGPTETSEPTTILGPTQTPKPVEPVFLSTNCLRLYILIVLRRDWLQ